MDKEYEGFLKTLEMGPKALITGTKTSYTFKQNEEFTITFDNPGMYFDTIFLYTISSSSAPRMKSIRTTSTSATFVCNETGTWEKYYLYEPSTNNVSNYFTLTITPSSGGGGGGSNKPPEISIIRDININTSQSAQILYTATDSDGYITKHELSENNGSSYYEIKPSGNSDYSYFVSYSTPGTRTCKVRVTDNSGLTATTPTFYINVKDVSGGGGTTDNPPKVYTTGDIDTNVSQSFTILYTATDDKGIDKHEFSDNNGSSYTTIYPIKSGDNYKYSMSYSSSGTRSCKIRVTDTKGQTATTATFYINVKATDGGDIDKPPSISTISDVDTKVSKSFDITYTATDDKGINTHEFSDNNGSSYRTIYPSKSGDTYTYSTVYSSSGTRNCKIRVTDTGGTTATSSTFYVRVREESVVDNPPTISRIGDIDAKQSQQFTIYYNANDDNGIAKHEFSDDNGSYYSVISPSGSAGSYSYNKTYSSTGSRACKIKVTDTAGQVATSPTFYINVSSSDSGNKPPITGVKSELYDAKVSYDDSHSNLKNVINSIIADGRFDEDTERVRLNNAFITYRDALSHYSKVHQKALDNVNENAKKEAENSAMEHTNNKFSSLAQDVDGFKMQVSREYATKTEMSTVEQKADKINWIVQSGTSQSNMTLTPELFSIISNNLVLRGKQIEITGETIIDGLVTANEYFVIREDGSVESKDLSISNVLSANLIVSNFLNVPYHDTSLTQDLTVYINPGFTYPSDYASELGILYLEDGATFKSFADLFNICPRNLNSYKLTVKMTSDVNETVSIEDVGNGVLELHMNGYSLNGWISIEGNNSLKFNLYGGTDSRNNTYGHIKPNQGCFHGNFRFGLLSKNTNVYIYDMKFYKGKATDYPNDCIGIAEESKAYIDNVVAVNTPNNIVRISEVSHAYVHGSMGTTDSTPFQAVRGSILHLNDTKQTGRSGGTTKTYAANNSQVYAEGVTWDTVSQSGSNNNNNNDSGVTKTVTIKSTGGRSYRTSGNYSGTWSSDAVVRQGRWTTALGFNEGYWFFGSALSNILNNKSNTIQSIKITVVRQSGGVHGNVTHYLRCHRHGSKPSSRPSLLGTDILNKSFVVSTGKSIVVTLTSSEINNLVKNNVSGFGLYTSSTAQGGYSCCSANLSVTITYKAGK